MYKPDALADFAGSIRVPSRICHSPDVKQLASKLKDQLWWRNDSDCIKGTERGLKKTNTGYIYLCVRGLLVPKGSGEDKLELEHLAYTTDHWMIPLVLWTWEELTPDLNSQNELAQKSVLSSPLPFFFMVFFSCFALLSVVQT